MKLSKYLVIGTIKNNIAGLPRVNLYIESYETLEAERRYRIIDDGRNDLEMSRFRSMQAAIDGAKAAWGLEGSAPWFPKWEK